MVDQSPVAHEQERLRQAREDGVPWRTWGPYLSERQWGTVREDYSANGDAWNSFPHDQARSRVYRWGEDGIAGFCDDQMRLCFAVAVWNGRDGIIKERLFGLTNAEGNHGEDVKEYYFYLDATPTSSYLKLLYKYPQAAFPYAELVHVSATRSRSEPEYELIDTGVFDADRYFDVFVEYAKAAPQEILIRISVVNRGPEAAELRVLPHLWFRNTWWRSPEAPKPSLERGLTRRGTKTIVAQHPDLGTRYLVCENAGELLFTANETNLTRLSSRPNTSPYVKDGINDYIVKGDTERSIRRGRDQVGGALRAHGRSGRDAGGPAPPDRDAPLVAGGRIRGLRRDLRGPRARGRRVLRRAHAGDGRPRTRRPSCARDSPACSGAGRRTSTTSAPGSRSTAWTRPAARRATSGTATGTTCTTAT